MKRFAQYTMRGRRALSSEATFCQLVMLTTCNTSSMSSNTRLATFVQSSHNPKLHELTQNAHSVPKVISSEEPMVANESS